MPSIRVSGIDPPADGTSHSVLGSRPASWVGKKQAPQPLASREHLGNKRRQGARVGVGAQRDPVREVAVANSNFMQLLGLIVGK
ncbi:hypothetical protein MGG_15623 [Pyricularia oryzae 70-15]|uniref:Uncharacterized protein n=1 Tax=Pyricularia oryzae (strain 70-15 / ATCC MYA-4617 / FGSC 8958) TaxID=242507 RepID=G4MW45_PYRO7|nr:uncharacterized protein MGG_15623 [Pyricularia oryzae 70-15]EHA54198.1 hypothetical protein MGG_15623 [Pyricularia oryzae 70-15]